MHTHTCTHAQHIHTHARTCTHTHDENREQEQSNKSDERKLLKSCRAALDVFQSIDRERQSAVLDSGFSVIQNSSYALTCTTFWFRTNQQTKKTVMEEFVFITAPKKTACVRCNHPTANTQTDKGLWGGTEPPGDARQHTRPVGNAHTHMHTHTHVNTHTQVRTHTHTRTHAHAHAHTPTLAHTQGECLPGALLFN